MTVVALVEPVDAALPASCRSPGRASAERQSLDRELRRPGTWAKRELPAPGPCSLARGCARARAASRARSRAQVHPGHADPAPALYLHRSTRALAVRRGVGAGLGRVPVAHARAAADHRPETRNVWHVRRLHVATAVSDGRAEPITERLRSAPRSRFAPTLQCLSLKLRIPICEYHDDATQSGPDRAQCEPASAALDASTRRETTSLESRRRARARARAKIALRRRFDRAWRCATPVAAGSHGRHPHENGRHVQRRGGELLHRRLRPARPRHGLVPRPAARERRHRRGARRPRIRAARREPRRSQARRS